MAASTAIASGEYILEFRQRQRIGGVDHWKLEAVPDKEGKRSFWIAIPAHPAKGAQLPLFSQREFETMSTETKQGLRYHLWVNRTGRFMRLTLDRSSSVCKANARIELMHEISPAGGTPGLWGGMENFYYLGQRLRTRSGNVEEAS